MELPVKNPNECRCSSCHKLLGIRQPEGRLEIKFSKALEVTATLPADIKCPRCGTANTAK